METTSGMESESNRTIRSGTCAALVAQENDDVEATALIDRLILIMKEYPSVGVCSPKLSM